MNPHQGAKPMAPKAPPMPKMAEHEPKAESQAEGESPVHEHLRSLHEKMGGMHAHVHHDGSKLTSHHVAEDGEVQGPHDHPNMEALKKHLDQFFGEEQQETPEAGYGGGGGGKQHHA